MPSVQYPPNLQVQYPPFNTPVQYPIEQKAAAYPRWTGGFDPYPYIYIYICIYIYIYIFVYKGKLLGIRVGYWELDLGIYGCYYSGDCYIPKRNNQSVGWFWLLLCRLHRVGTALRVVKKIYGCSCFCWSKIVLSGWWLKTVLFCHLHTLSWFCFFSHVTCLFVEVSSFTRMENSQKKKLRDVRIFQVFTWAPFRLWWLMSLPTYKNIDIRYINKMFFFGYARLYLTTDGLLPCRFGRLR